MSEVDDLEREFANDQPWVRHRRVTNKLLKSGKAKMQRAAKRGRRYMQLNGRFMHEHSPNQPYDPSRGAR